MSLSNGSITQFYQAGPTSSMTASGIFRWIYTRELNTGGVLLHTEAGTTPGSEAFNSFQIYKNYSEVSITPTAVLVGYEVGMDLTSGSTNDTVVGPLAGYNLAHSAAVTVLGGAAGGNVLNGVGNTSVGNNSMGNFATETLGARGSSRLFAQVGPPLVSEPMLCDVQSPTEVLPAVDARTTNMFLTGDLTSATLYAAYELDRSRSLVATSSLPGLPFKQTSWGENSAFGANALKVIGVFSQFNTGIGAESGANLQWGDNNTFVGHSASAAANIARCNTVVGAAAACNMGAFSDSDANRFPVPADPKAKRFDFVDIAEEVSYNTIIGSRAGDRIVVDATYTRANPTDPSIHNARNNVLIGHGCGSPYVFSSTLHLTGPYNVLVGSHAAPQMTNGKENVMCGFYTAPSFATGTGNVILGSSTPAWQMVNHPFGEGALGEGWVYNTAANPTLSLSTAPLFASGDANVIIGKGAGQNLMVADNNVSIGYLSGLGATTSSSVAIGSNATAGGNSSIALGDTATASANTSIALGSSATASVANAIAIGTSANSPFADSVTFGRTATALAANTFQVGCTTVPLRISESAPAHTYQFAPLNIAAAVVLTWQGIQGGIVVGTPGAAVLLTTPTAANIYSNVMPGALVNQGVRMKLINLDAVAGNTWTVTAGDGNVNIVGDPIIAGSTSRDLLFLCTNAAVPIIQIFM